MRLVKPLILAIIVVLLAVVGVQNSNLFVDSRELKVDLWVWHYESAPVPLAVYFFVFFLAGLLMTFFHGLKDKFKLKRVIKQHIATISRLEGEVNRLTVSPGSEQLPQPQANKVKNTSSPSS